MIVDSKEIYYININVLHIYWIFFKNVQPHYWFDFGIVFNLDNPW